MIHIESLITALSSENISVRDRDDMIVALRLLRNECRDWRESVWVMTAGTLEDYRAHDCEYCKMPIDRLRSSVAAIARCRIAAAAETLWTPPEPVLPTPQLFP